MNQDSRRWFDCAYEFLQFDLPFGLLTTEADEKAMDITVKKHNLGEQNIKKLRKILMGFYRRLPCEQDFIEEKESVLRDLVPDFKKQFPFVETAIHFGRIRGGY